jgi:hypothetical protein
MSISAALNRCFAVMAKGLQRNVADHNWPFAFARQSAAPVCYFFQLLQEARVLIVEETSREVSIRGSPN